MRIKPIGVAEGDGGGTTAYSTDGVVLYTPTQAETNYTSFILIAKKTGCIPVCVTVVTTSSATPGTVLLAPVTHTSAVIPTVSTLTGHTAQTGDSYAIVNSGTHGNAAIKGYVDDIGVAGAGLTAVPWNAAWDAEVQSECADALTAYDPPTNAEMEARTLLSAAYGTAANQATIIGYIDTEIASVLAAVDTEVAAILADTNELQTDWANGGRLDLILDGCATPAQVNAEVLDVVGTDTLVDGRTIVSAMRITGAAVAGRISGAGTGTETFLGFDESTTRIVITVDSSGNRTDVVYS